MAFPALFAIIVGFGMIAQWALSCLTNQILELKTEPIQIIFHISAEMLTAILLIVAGIGLITGWEFAREIFLIAAGMLFYTAVVSSGYFAQKGDWYWVVLFALIIALGIVSICLVI